MCDNDCNLLCQQADGGGHKGLDDSRFGQKTAVSVLLPTYLFLVPWCPQEQEEESEDVRVALLQMQYPQFPLETVTTALAAQLGQMHGAATLLQLQADAVHAWNTRQRNLELVQINSKPKADRCLQDLSRVGMRGSGA